MQNKWEKIWEVEEENAESGAKFQEDDTMTGINMVDGMPTMVLKRVLFSSFTFLANSLHLWDHDTVMTRLCPS